MGHTPGRGHRRKSDPPKKRRHQRRAAAKRAEADRIYDEAKRFWDAMPTEAQWMRPDLDPEIVRPCWRD